MCPIKPRRRWAAMGSRWAHCNLSCARKCPMCPAGGFSRLFLSCFFPVWPVGSGGAASRRGAQQAPLRGIWGGGRGRGEWPELPQERKGPFPKISRKTKRPLLPSLTPLCFRATLRVAQVPQKGELVCTLCLACWGCWAESSP